MNLNNYKDLLRFSRNFFAKTGGKKVVLVRSCENLGALSGSLNGWMNVKLSEYGILRR
jgi:hypothetical protein